MAFGSAINICRIKVNNISIDGLRLYLGNELIEFVNSFKYLGVVFDSTLSWSMHIASVKKRSAYALYRIRMNDSNLSVSLKRKLVSALIFPIYDYCACVLTNLSLELERSLLVSFNNCVRFILRIKQREHISRHRRHLAGLCLGTVGFS